MRLLFLGSGEFGLPTLEDLHAHHQLVAVVTQPDRPAGRRRQLAATPVAQWVDQRNAEAGEGGMIDLVKAEDVNAPEFVEQVRRYQADAAVVVAFGQKLSAELIDALGGLAVNLHGSLVPAYRGAAPINWAIINGEKVTGVSVIGLAQRMDAGEVYATADLTIDPNETAGELHDRLARLGPRAINHVLQDYQAGTLQPAPQDDSRASRAPKLSRADGTVDFDQPATTIRNRIHGLTPWPGCRVRWHCRATGQTKPLTLLRVQAIPEPPAFLSHHLNDVPPPRPGTVLEPLLVVTNPGVVKLLQVQAPGTRVMDAHAFARGHQLAPGDMLEPITDPSE